MNIRINGKKTGQALLIIIVVLGVFVALGEMVKQVPISIIPTQLAGAWDYILTFFSLPAIISVAAFLRSIGGYLKNYFKSDFSESYDIKKLGETLAYYVSTLTTLLSLATLLPEPYNEIVSAIGTAVIVVLDLAKSQLKDIRAVVP